MESFTLAIPRWQARVSEVMESPGGTSRRSDENLVGVGGQDASGAGRAEASRVLPIAGCFGGCHDGGNAGLLFSFS